MIDLELPMGKRSRSYRILEMLPGLVSYSMLLLIIPLSIFSPLLASIYLLLFVITLVIRSIGIASHSLSGYHQLKSAMRIDWAKRLSHLEDPVSSYKTVMQQSQRSVRVHSENLRLVSADVSSFPKPSQIYNAVIITAYNEPYEVIQPTLQSLVDTTYDKQRMIVVFAYEERGGQEIENVALRLEQEFGKQFFHYMLVKHPSNLPDEIIGKGPNLTYAGKKLASYCQSERINTNRVIITTLDCDNKPYRSYFDYVTYEFIVHSNRKHLSFQPISLYFSNIWDAPAPMRIIAIGNSFWTIVSSMRPHLLRNFAAHSQPMSALKEMEFWSKKSIVEDGHQYWRSYFYFGGNYAVVPIYVPVYQDAVLAATLKKTMITQFKQLRRWAYGASDIPYVATRLFSKKRNVPFFAGLARFMRLVESHISLATVAILVAIGGWVPLAINPDAEYNIVVHNLPYVIGQVQFYAMIGLFITIVLTLRLLPPRPGRYRRIKHVSMIAQWVFMPVTAIAFNALASLTAQTYLLFGKYLDTFDVTEKTKK